MIFVVDFIFYVGPERGDEDAKRRSFRGFQLKIISLETLNRVPGVNINSLAYLTAFYVLYTFQENVFWPFH